VTLDQTSPAGLVQWTVTSEAKAEDYFETERNPTNANL